MSGHSQAILELSDQCFYTGQLIFLMASDEKKKKDFLQSSYDFIQVHVQ